MLTLSEYMDMDAVTLARGIRSKEFSCAEVTACAIQRAQNTNPAINAIVTENYDHASEQARRIDVDSSLLDKSQLAAVPNKSPEHGEGLAGRIW